MNLENEDMKNQIMITSEIPEELFQAVEIVRASGVWNMAALSTQFRFVESDYRNCIDTIKKIYVDICNKNNNLHYIEKPATDSRLELVFVLYDICDKYYDKLPRDTYNISKSSNIKIS